MCKSLNSSVNCAGDVVCCSFTVLSC